MTYDVEDDFVENSFALLIMPKGSVNDKSMNIATGVFIPEGYDDDTTNAMQNVLYVLSACFDRLNSDKKFAKEMTEFTQKMFDKIEKKAKKAEKQAKKEAEEKAANKGSAIVKLRPDTPTKGNA